MRGEPGESDAPAEMPDSPHSYRHSFPVFRTTVFRSTVIGRLPCRIAARLAARRRLRGLAVSGLPAVLTVGGLIPVLTDGSAPLAPPSLRAPSVIECSGWARCDARGFNSYGYAAHGWRSFWRMSPGDQCTNYAAYVESVVYRVREPRFLLGNGGQWASTAAAHGALVNHTPSVGAVAEWDGGTFGIGPVGHVGVVEAVGPHASYIVVSVWTRIRAHQAANLWQPWPSHFIHFRVPRRTDVGYFNPRSARFGLRYSLTAGPAGRTGHLGFHGVVPLIGDWRGGGTDDTGYYDPRYGTFYLRQSQRFGPASHKFTFGPPHVIPLVGDWNGNGKDGVGYYNPRTGIFNVRNALRHGRPAGSFRFGPPHMIPVAGNWSGAGRHDGVGYYNPWAGTFHLRNRASKGRASEVIRFMPRHMIPLAGDWFGV